MSIDFASSFAALILAFVVLGVLGFGLVLVRDCKLAWGAVILLGMTGILIWAMAVLYH